MRGTGRNLLVINKKAELFDFVEIKDSMLYICGAHRMVAEVSLQEIHAVLYCEELRNITWIIHGKDTYKITMIMGQTECFEKFLVYFKAHYKDAEFSVQNKKIGGYTSAIVEKLQEGTVLTIIDKKVEEKIIYCPDCGVQCDPSIPYCMECGATVG